MGKPASGETPDSGRVAECGMVIQSFLGHGVGNEANFLFCEDREEEMRESRGGGRLDGFIEGASDQAAGDNPAKLPDEPLAYLSLQLRDDIGEGAYGSENAPAWGGADVGGACFHNVAFVTLLILKLDQSSTNRVKKGANQTGFRLLRIMVFAV